jgi:carbon storage regulator
VLALTRKIGERIVIGDNIIVTIVDIKGDSIRVGIDAPKAVKIYRGEIYDEIVAENQKAATPLSKIGMDMLKDIFLKNK